MNNLKLIQNWYVSKCDGEWEHQYGLTLETVDNPGWRIEIDGESGKKPIKINVDRDDGDWFFVNAAENKLKGSCGAENLEELLDHVAKWLMD